MNESDTPAKVGSSEGLGRLSVGNGFFVERRQNGDLAICDYGGGLHMADIAERAMAEEIERLRGVLAAIDRHSVNTLRTNSKDRGDWAEDVAFMGKLARGH